MTANAIPRLFANICGSPGSIPLQTSAYASKSGEAGRDMLIASVRSFSDVITVHPKGMNMSSAQPMRRP